MAGEPVVMQIGRGAWPLAIVAAAGAAWLYLMPEPPARQLTAVRLETRPIESRLSGEFAWAPFRSATRDALGGNLRLAEAVGRTLETYEKEPTPETAHAAGLAYLLGGQTSEALERLRAAAEQLDAADAYSDVSAALIEIGRGADSPGWNFEALAAADRALSRDARHPAALFNRALALERIGMRDQAREAWTDYLAVDPAGAWSNEARDRRDALAPEPRFIEALDREYARVAADAGAAAAFARRDPFGARGLGLRDVAGRWATAVMQGDEGAAAQHLAVARNLGNAVAQQGGDRMLARAVAAIDAAGPEARRTLAAAHDQYTRGLLAFAGARPVEAEPLLRDAAQAFATHGSPARFAGRCFAANARFDRGERQEAQREIEELLRVIPDEFPAYRAMASWELGIMRAGGGEWGDAIVALEQSVSAFERLNEDEPAAGVHRMLAFAHDRIGNPETASSHWTAALSGVGRRTDAPLIKAVESIVDDAIVRRQWRVAESFLRLHADMTRARGDSMPLATALFLRAAVRARLNDADGAAADVAAGRAAAAGVKDPAHRAYLRIAERRARALLPSTSPAEAVELLSQALGEESAHRVSMELPGLLLARARARRAAGDDRGAAADLERGIVELERHRESLPAGALRWGAFHAAEELFDEAIELAIDRGDAAAAFRASERARARSLLDAYARPPVLELARIPAGVVVVEYAALPSRLAIFTADASGVQVTTAGVTRETLEREIDALTGVLRAGSRSGEDEAAVVRRRLFAPVEARIRGAESLVFVPDATTAGTPFTALRSDDGRFLVQQYRIVVAPSAALFVAAAERRPAAAAPASAVVISSSASAGAGVLRHAVREAERIASLYARGDHLHDAKTDPERLFARAGDVDVIHFAGHAIGDARGLEPASIVLRGKDGIERRMRVADLAALRLRPTATVVLAGCNTARGERRAAEGAISVAYGFLAAGAPSVIATLWPISDDAAAVFFPRLHRRLVEGLSPADALRDTQIECIERGDVPSSLWAAVQVIGS